ncbi:UNVERIFIED_CONTAM: hypothetical protein NCL1_01159 [Trichonephila clavipes]
MPGTDRFPAGPDHRAGILPEESGQAVRPLARALGVMELGPGETGAQGGDMHAGRLQLQVQRLRHVQHIGLDAGVEHARRVGRERRQRRHVDDAAPAPLRHAAAEAVRQLGQAGDHDLDHGAHVGDREIQERHRFGESGIVDEDIDLETLGRRLRFQRGGRLRPRQVGGTDQHAHAMRGGQFVGERLQAVGTARHQHQIVPFRGQQTCERLAQTRRRTGDQRPFPGTRSVTCRHDAALLRCHGRMPENTASCRHERRQTPRDLPPPAGAQPRAHHRAELQLAVRAADRGAAVGAGHRRRREQGHGEAVPGRRHAGEDAGARCRRPEAVHQDHRPVQHQGRERHQDLPHPDRGARRRGAADARGAGAAARGRPQDRQRGAQHRLRPAHHRDRHAHLPGLQPHPHRPRQGRAGGRAQAHAPRAGGIPA